MIDKFYKNNEKDFNLLEEFIPVVSRVHGSSHPEFCEVEKYFNNILDKLSNSKDEVSLEEEFNNIKTVTNNYTVPNNVCESYETVYITLEKLDKSLKL